MKRSRIRRKSKTCDKTDRALKILCSELGYQWRTQYGYSLWVCANELCTNVYAEWHHAEGRNAGDAFPSKLDPTTLVPLCHACHEAETNRKGPKTNFLKPYPVFNAYTARLKYDIVREYGPITGNMKYNKNRVADIIIKMLGD